MKSIIYVGMDVHSSNYTLTSYMVGNDNCFATVQVEPDYKNILKYLEKVQENMGTPCEFHCGYEAGCLGYVLYHQLRDHGIDCTILAPTTMPTYQKKKSRPTSGMLRRLHAAWHSTLIARCMFRRKPMLPSKNISVCETHTKQP
mgnify:CR=1 FL=1